MRRSARLSLALALCFAISGCSDRYDRVAEQKVDGVVVRIGLNRMHPYLAEYKRFLEVEHDGKTDKKELFADTGGYAWVALINNRGVLEVKTIDEVEYSLPVESLPKKMRLYLGKFDFDSGKIYRFIPATSDPHEPGPPK